ncbi:integrase [Gulosibacter molinativorax]|uniref:Integrase n=2 Tax=Gulosibacter molinativorax TaxID=256821 RepID=A0ABT7CC91_9MICO|nr:integrase [Gulosibacter molinativorax]
MSLEKWPVPAEWETAIHLYLQHERASGAPLTTCATREQHLRQLARAMKTSPWDIEPEQLLAWFSTRTWARETRRGRRTTYRSFWAWAVATGRTDVNAAAVLPAVKPAPPQPRPIPAAPLSLGIASSNARTALILTLAAEVGMRRAEIAQAHTRDLIPDLDGHSIVVHGKGGKDRIVPLSDDLASELRQLPEGYFFPGRDNGHLSPRYVGKLAANALPGEWTLHSGRHRFATNAHRASGDLLVVQDLLGHASPATTRVYIAPDRSRARAVVQSLPRAA